MEIESGWFLKSMGNKVVMKGIEKQMKAHKARRISLTVNGRSYELEEGAGPARWIHRRRY